MLASMYGLKFPWKKLRAVRSAASTWWVTCSECSSRRRYTAAPSITASSARSSTLSPPPPRLLDLGPLEHLPPRLDSTTQNSARPRTRAAQSTRMSKVSTHSQPTCTHPLPRLVLDPATPAHALALRTQDTLAATASIWSRVRSLSLPRISSSCTRRRRSPAHPQLTPALANFPRCCCSSQTRRSRRRADASRPRPARQTRTRQPLPPTRTASNHRPRSPPTHLSNPLTNSLTRTRTLTRTTLYPPRAHQYRARPSRPLPSRATRPATASQVRKDSLRRLRRRPPARHASRVRSLRARWDCIRNRRRAR